MAEERAAAICLCPHCLIPSDLPGPCQNCGSERLVCQTGEPGDPSRRPLMTAAGKIKSQAPLWWLRHTLGDLAEIAAQAAEP